MKTKTICVSPELTYDKILGHDKNLVFTSLLSKYRNEHNTNIIDEAEETLDELVYVPSKFKLWSGRFVRYLDATDPLRLKLSSGGFVVSDNTYTIRLKVDDRLLTVGKRNRFFFMGLTNVDRTYLYFKDELNSQLKK